MKHDLPEVLLRREAGTAPAFWTRRRRVLAAVIGVLALVGLGFPVENVVVANGHVIPSDRVKSVQHLEGGIITRVMVREGERVSRGQPLVDIDLGGTSLNLEGLTARDATTRAAIVRLRAESAGRPLSAGDFPAGLPESVRDAELGAWHARRLEQDGIVAGARAALAQAQGQQAGQREKIAGLVQRIALYRKELGISEQLLAEQLIGELEVLEKRRQIEELQSELAVARQDLVSATAGVAQAQAKIAQAEGQFRSRASDELADSERDLASIAQDLARARSQRERTVVTAPSEGIVKGLRNQSVGWVVKPGEQIMQIVPDDEQVMIEAQLDPNDRGFVAVGQPAHIKISAYDYLRYGAVDGKVALVAADADRDPASPDTPPYYRLLVGTARNYVGTPENRMTAGMESEVDLVVGHDPFIWYMLRPVLRLQREAFREP